MRTIKTTAESENQLGWGKDYKNRCNVITVRIQRDLFVVSMCAHPLAKRARRVSKVFVLERSDGLKVFC